MVRKKGQSASNAAILIVAITVILILYILFLPPEDRARLLEGSSTNETLDPSPEEPLLLLEENVGRLEYRASEEINYNIQSFTLRAISQAAQVHSRNSLYTKTSVFGSEEDLISFNLNPDDTQDLILSFNVARSLGELEIIFNGERIFFSEVSTGNSPPIYIKQEDLQRNNIIEFKVSSPGIAFWRVNSYLLTDIKLVGEVTDRSQSENYQTITINSKDYQNLKTTNFRYVPVCDQGQIEGMRIIVNDFSIFEGIPDCNIVNTITIGSDLLYEGINNLRFVLEKGQMNIYDLRLTSSVDMPENPLYYFEMEDEYFINETLRSTREAELDLRFTNTDRKRVDLFINGVIIGIITEDRSVTRDISNYVLPGTNTIEIRPRQTIDIAQLKIELK